MKNFFLLILPCVLINCAQGNCRSQGKSLQQGVTPVSSASEEKIRIFKYDGSLQCGLGKAIALDEMAKELKSLMIYSSSNKPDGLMHISQCGTPTGKANVYEIDRKDLPTAKKAGFKEWLWD